MPARSYTKVDHPWQATIGRSTPHPATFYAELIGQTLRYGLPAARRGGRALAPIARRGIPEKALGVAIRAVGGVRTTADATADAYLHAARDAWSDLQRVDPTLPPPEDLEVLVLRRASANTLFLFAGDATPVLVGKIPLAEPEPVLRETAALVIAAPIGVAPRSFGSIDGLGHVQRGLRGRAMRVEPVRVSSAAKLAWTAQHDALARGLARLAGATTSPTESSWANDGVIETAISHPGMTTDTRRAIESAAHDLRSHPVSVLRHMDTSPQNVLFDGDTLEGLVDWEDATSSGAPAADVLNAATAVIENGVGLVRWDERTVVDAFLQVWFHSPFGAEARAAAACTARAAGVPDELHGALQLVFFARRVGLRMLAPQRYATSASAALAAVEALRASWKSAA